MKILLISFNVQEDVFPLGLNYLKAYALKYHSDVEIRIKEFSFEARHSYETNKNIELHALACIQPEKPDIVALSCYIWSGEAAVNFANAVKELNEKIRIILGGVEVNEDLISENIDFIITGEGEIAFKEIIDHFKNQRKLEDVHNIITKKDNNIIRTKEAVIEDLDEIPFPYTQSEEKNFSVVRLETARGCTFSCNFCHYAIPKLRYFSLEYLQENIKYLFDNFNFKNLTFLDANFNSDIDRMFKILDIVEEKVKKDEGKRKINLHFELRPELITKKMVDRLSKYSFYIRTELGFQSSDKEVLEFANRPTNMKRVKEALSYLDNSPIQYKIDLMYGLPRDTFFKFLKSIQFILNNAKKQKKIVAHHYMLLNNTEFSKNNNKNNSIKRITPKSSSMVIKTDSQNAYDFYLTKLFVDTINKELDFYNK